MNIPDIVGRMTEEETAEMLTACIINLTDQRMIETIAGVLSIEQKRDLVEYFALDMKE
jgi:hypothetical protein